MKSQLLNVETLQQEEREREREPREERFGGRGVGGAEGTELTPGGHRGCDKEEPSGGIPWTKVPVREVMSGEYQT